VPDGAAPAAAGAAADWSCRRRVMAPAAFDQHRPASGIPPPRPRSLRWPRWSGRLEAIVGAAHHWYERRNNLVLLRRMVVGDDRLESAALDAEGGPFDLRASSVLSSTSERHPRRDGAAGGEEADALVRPGHHHAAGWRRSRRAAPPGGCRPQVHLWPPRPISILGLSGTLRSRASGNTVGPWLSRLPDAVQAGDGCHR
jgi:hypothetical protein